MSNENQKARTHKVISQPKRPTLLELADNFTKATVEWAGAGFPITSEEDYMERHEICKSCEHWDSMAFKQMGRCNLCGCSGFKLYLATQKCPALKWLPVTPASKENAAKPPPEDTGS